MGFLIGLCIFVLLLLCLLLLPVYVRLYKDDAGKAQVSLKILFFSIPLDKKEEKKSEKESAVLKQFGLSQYTGGKNWKKQISENGLLSALRDFVKILKPFFSALEQIARKFRVCKAYLEVTTAGEHAAIEYGAACAVLYPLSAFLQNHVKGNTRKMNVDVRCDFEAFSPEISYDLVLRIFVFNLIPVGFKLLTSLWKENKAHEGK